LRRFFGSRAVRVVGVVSLLSLLVVVVVLLFLILDWYVAPTKPSERKDLVLALAQILGGTALLSGLYFTWRTLQVNREGQITERFTRAIDQLGKIENGQKLFEIRVGGIYALERIARESEEDYEPIMEVLTAYVRQNAPLKPGKETAEEESDKEERTPDPDIQAITTVLRRLTRLHGQGQPGSLNLHDTDLYRVNLQGAYLYEADLRGADLQEADLQEAYLYGADLRGADLQEANLQGANLYEANLYEAKLYRVDLQGANLQKANLQGAFLRGADLPKANLREAYLYGADLRGADLQKANLQGANLQEANVTDEQLASTLSLQGATMPHGQEDEDWIKDKEGGGKDVENE
jgi:hypothetical protein